MKKFKKLLFWILIVIMTSASLALVFNDKIAKFLSSRTADKISQTSADDMKKNKGKGNFDYNAVKSISPLDIIENAWRTQKFPVIGLIAIPELEINLPIFDGVGYYELMYGAGTMKANQEMGQGNYVLASHRMFPMWGAGDVSKMLFTNLENAKSGQRIYLTDKIKVYEYEVDKVEIIGQVKESMIKDVERGATSALNSSEVDNEPNKLLESQTFLKEITLITCADLEANHHILVHGRFTKAVKFNEKSAEVFSHDFNQ